MTPSPQSVVVPLEDWQHVIGALKNAKARLPMGAAIGNVSDALSKVEHLRAAPAPSSLAGGDRKQFLCDILYGVALDGNEPIGETADRILAALSPEAPARSGRIVAGEFLPDSVQEAPARDGETWTTMAKWTEETFGPVSLERIATRANEEMQELLADPSDVMEAADVCIVLSRYPGIEDAINRKMAINRKREWRLNGDGSGYHVKSDDLAALTPRHEAPACPHDAYETDSAGQPVRCSDCHEAPAEGAGEMDDDDASTYAPSVAGLSDYLWNQAQAADSVEGRCILEMWREAVDALRARSSAPEARS